MITELKEPLSALTIEKLLKAKAILDAEELPTNDQFTRFIQKHFPRSKNKRICRK